MLRIPNLKRLIIPKVMVFGFTFIHTLFIIPTNDMLLMFHTNFLKHPLQNL